MSGFLNGAYFVINYIIDMGASVMLPIIIAILSIILGVKVGKAIRAGLRKAFCAFFPYTERVTFVHSDRFVFHNIRSPDKMQEAPPSFPVFYPWSAHATTCIPGLSVRGCAGRRLAVYSFPDCMEAAIHSDRALSQTLRPHYRAGIPACQS